MSKIAPQKTRRKRQTASLAELEALADSIGDFVQHWGFKRIHGRIWSHLFLSDRPLSPTELVKSLRVSKALISFSIRDLMKFDVIRECGKGRGRTQLYEANPDVTFVILQVLRIRESQLIEKANRAQARLGALPGDAVRGSGLSKERVVELGRLIQGAQGFLANLFSIPELSLDIGSGLKSMKMH